MTPAPAPSHAPSLQSSGLGVISKVLILIVLCIAGIVGLISSPARAPQHPEIPNQSRSASINPLTAHIQASGRAAHNKSPLKPRSTHPSHPFVAFDSDGAVRASS